MGVLSSGHPVRSPLSSGGAPGFTLALLVTLALGIGGTTAIFSIVDGVVLRPLPYQDSSRIVRLNRISASGGVDSFSAPDYRDLKRDATTFSAIAGYRSDIVDVTGRGEPIRIIGTQTTAAFFDVFDAPPLLGRAYHEATDKPGAPVAVIGESIWRQQFGADPSVIGSQVRLNGALTEIIGVMPQWVRHPAKSDAWTLSPLDVPTSPFGAVADEDDSRGVHYFTAVARVSPSHQLSDAREQVKAIAKRIADQNSGSAGESVDAEPLATNMVANVRTAMMVLLSAVGVVLLIACANVAGLLVARGASRRREFAVRTALGAPRGRLVRQLLTESVVLALAGGALGLIVASWTLQLLIGVAPENLPRLDDVVLDWRIALFALAAAIGVGVLFGLTPALQSSRPELNSDLKDGGRSGTARTGLRNVMVVAQVALALVLLIGAGLMLTSFARLQAVDPGFRTTEMVTVELMLPLARFNEDAQRSLLHECARAAASESGNRAIRDAVPVSVRRRQRADQPGDRRPARETSSATGVGRPQFDFARISPGVRCPADPRPRLRRERWPQVAAGRLDQRVDDQGIRRQGSHRRKDRHGRSRDHRRHRVGCAAPVARRRAESRRLPAVYPVRIALHGCGRPHRSRRGRRGLRGEGCRRANRSGPADRRRQDDGADHR